MMLDTQSALKRLTDLRRDSQRQRAYYDAWWSLAKVYDHGPQWGYVNLNTTDSSADVKFLRQITDPRRSDLRVAMNRIHRHVVRLVASMAPESVTFNLFGRASRDYIDVYSAQKLLSRHIEDIDGLTVLRDKEDYRHVLGSVLVRRTLQMSGSPIEYAGRTVRQFMPSWCVVEPHEILRDPASITTRFDDENIFCHEKPWLAADIKRCFGVEVKTSKSLGDLTYFQKHLNAATGLVSDRGVTDSQQPAVLLYECYFQDSDSPANWPYVLYAYSDTATVGELNPLGELRPNPFYGLPFHHFIYDRIIESPWGRGVPHIAMQGQDIFNISLTWLVRWMQEGCGRWMLPKGSIPSSEISNMLTNRLDKPLEYSPFQGLKPERTAPPPLNPAAMTILQQAPDWMQEVLGMTGVQFGEPAGRRGEAGAAIEMRLGEANAIIEKTRTDDKEVLAELLYGTLMDITNPNLALYGRAKKLLGDSISDANLNSLFRRPTADVICRVSVHPTTVRPQTQAEKKNEFVSLHNEQMMEASDAKFEMLLRGVEVDTSMKHNYDRQMIEIRRILNGEQVLPRMPEDHDVHIRTLALFLNSPEAMDLDEQQTDALNQHWSAHWQAKMAIAQGMALTQPPPQQQRPSPPRQPQGAAEAVGFVQPAQTA